MQGLRASLKPGMAMKQADAAVTAALVPVCLAGEKADRARAKKLGELTALTSTYDQTEFMMKTGWATFPGQADPNRGRASGEVPLVKVEPIEAKARAGEGTG